MPMRHIQKDTCSGFSKTCENCKHVINYGYVLQNGKRVFSKRSGFDSETRNMCGAPKCGQEVLGHFKCSNGKFEQK